MLNFPELRESAALRTGTVDELLWVTLDAWPDGRWEIIVRGLRPPARRLQAFYGDEVTAREDLAWIYGACEPFGRWFVSRYRSRWPAAAQAAAG